MNKDQFDSEIRRISIDLWNLCKQYNNDFDFLDLSVSNTKSELLSESNMYAWIHAWNSQDSTKTQLIDISQFFDKEEENVEVLRRSNRSCSYDSYEARLP